MADLGFPVGGGTTLVGGGTTFVGGGANSLFAYVSKKLYVKMKELVPLGARAPTQDLKLIGSSWIVFEEKDEGRHLMGQDASIS